jgi:hypothetical protein
MNRSATAPATPAQRAVASRTREQLANDRKLPGQSVRRDPQRVPSHPAQGRSAQNHPPANHSHLDHPPRSHSKRELPKAALYPLRRLTYRRLHPSGSPSPVNRRGANPSTKVPKVVDRRVAAHLGLGVPAPEGLQIALRAATRETPPGLRGGGRRQGQGTVDKTSVPRFLPKNSFPNN